MSIRVRTPYILALLITIIAVCGGFLIFTQMDLLIFDHLGHLANGKLAYANLPHQFQYSFFRGEIFGQSYPLLQDYILGALYYLTGESLHFYPYYLIMLFLFFLGCVSLLIKDLATDKSKIFLLFTFTLFLIKGGSGLNYQGGSLADLAIYGMSNQFLSFSFLTLLLRDLLFKDHSQKRHITLWLILCLLSHFLTGVVAIGLCLLNLKTNWRSVLKAVALCSFFLIPLGQTSFISALVSTPLHLTIFLPLMVLLPTTQKKFRPYLLFSFILVVPNILAQSEWIANNLLPSFHYYRFQAYSLFIIAVVLTKIIDEGIPHKSFLYASCLLFMGLLIEVRVYPFDLRNMTDNSVLPQVCQNLQGKVLFFPPLRAIDTSLSSLCVIQGGQSVKGLYWEGDKTNLLASSYTSLLDGGPFLLPSLVTDLSNEERENILSHYIDDYQIKYIWYPLDYHLLMKGRNSSSEKFVRLTHLIESNKLIRQTLIQGQSYGLYQIAQANPLFRALSPDDLIAPRQINLGQEIKYYFNYIKMRKWGKIFFTDVPLTAPIIPSSTFTYKQLSGERFILEFGNNEQIVAAKILSTPYLKIFEGEGEIYDAYPTPLIKGKGTVIIGFKRPLIVLFGYYLSAIAAILLLANAIYWRKKCNV